MKKKTKKTKAHKTMKKTTKTYKGPERRRFVRLNFTTPLAVKVCKPKTIRKILEGYTSNISRSGISCSINYRVHKNDILWLSFDRSTLTICHELECHSLIYQNGVVGKVVRVNRLKKDTYSIGIQFLTREEKFKSYILPDIYFGRMTSSEVDDEVIRDEDIQEQPEEEAEEIDENDEDSRESEDEEV